MENSQLISFASLVMLAVVPYILASQGTMLAGTWSGTLDDHQL